MGVRSAAKVAVQFCRGGNIRRVLRRLRKTPTLVSCVEESPVLDDRTAYGCPELVLPQYGGAVSMKPARYTVFHLARKRILGVQGTFKKEITTRTIRMLITRPRNHTHHNPHRPTTRTP